MTCPPKAMPPGFLATMSECDKAAMYEEALFQLASGTKRAEVRHGDYFVRYHMGSTTYLERALARSRALCGNRTAITIGRTIPWPQAMPPRRQF